MGTICVMGLSYCPNVYAKLNKPFPMQKASQVITAEKTEVLGFLGYRIISDTSVEVYLYEREGLADESFYGLLITTVSGEKWFINMNKKYLPLD
jgi:hypothetical protein